MGKPFVLTDGELLEKLTDEFDLFKKETRRIIGDLQRENAALKERLARYENPKNSGNSSIPPSRDPFRKTKSLRGRANRPQGGQKGHDGNKLKMIGAPDAVAIHDIEKCSCCGKGLEGDSHRWDARQVFNIPPLPWRSPRDWGLFLWGEISSFRTLSRDQAQLLCLCKKLLLIYRGRTLRF